MAILKYNASPRPEASLKNVNYILRDDACLKFETIHLPEIETKIDARSFAAMREMEEQLMPQRGAGTPRNHHRMVLTLPDETDPDKALQLVKNFVEKEFPGTRSIIAIHKSENAPGLHSHIWVDARKLNGKKLDLGTKYYKLDKLYSELYDRTYKTNYTAEFAEKRRFNAKNEISTYTPQLEKLIEAQKRNEQRRIDGGKYIVARAGAGINNANRKIDELAFIERNRLEIASWHLQRPSKQDDQHSPHAEQRVELAPEQIARTTGAGNRMV
jgi:hypothetical protein